MTFLNLALLSLAAYRTWRLLGHDEVLDLPRDWVTRADDDERYRETLDRFLRCPWCLGFWVSLAWWGSWALEPEWTLKAAAPWAIAAVVGLTAKNLDR